MDNIKYTVEIFESKKSLGIRFPPQLEVKYGFFGLYAVEKDHSSDLLDYLVKFVRRFGTTTEPPIDTYANREGFSYFKFEYYELIPLMVKSLELIYNVDQSRKKRYSRSYSPEQMEPLKVGEILHYKRLKNAYNFLLISYFSKMLSKK